MVQDPSYGEELHLSVANLFNSATGETKQIMSQFTDADHVLEEGWEIDYNSPRNVFTEKEVAYCVSVPGLSGWVQMSVPAAKIEDAMGSLNISQQPTTVASNIQERYPLHGEPHSAALVKFYSPSNVPKVANIVDVVGIYELGLNSKAATATAHGNEGETDEDAEDAKWPCIHAIFCQPLSTSILVPGIPPSIKADEYLDRRNMCLSYLTSVLGGDGLAANFLLLHLLSRTAVVQDAKVGKFSLNLIGFPSVDASLPPPQPTEDEEGKEKGSSNCKFSFKPSAAKWISNAVSQLVPHAVEIPFELGLLNESRFVPNAESGDLSSGVLQLAPGTEVICDEACLHEGTLGEHGVRNLQSLQTLILDQVVTYMYPYQPIEMATSLRVLLLSAGKSLLQCDSELYLNEVAVRFMAGIQDGKPTDLKPLDPMHMEQLRHYLETARNLEFSVPTDVSDKISGEYADLRRNAHDKGEKMMTQTELTQLVTVARLVSLGKGETELSMDSWKEAKELEQRRSERNRPFLAKKKH